ncbi:MAG: helix-turn-helix domain-containing protein [Parvibaculaceae bacterium]|nr:helix-turn-helix domain-containing protein [Parvibaculaceae bacterium]
MSWQCSSWVSGLKVGNSARKCVLFILANRHNPDTGLCCPSIQSIAEEAEMSQRSVIRHLNALEEEGFIERDERREGGGSWSTNQYYFPGLEHWQRALQERAGRAGKPGSSAVAPVRSQPENGGKHPSDNLAHGDAVAPKNGGKGPSDNLARGEPPCDTGVTHHVTLVSPAYKCLTERLTERSAGAREAEAEATPPDVPARPASGPPMVRGVRVDGDVDRVDSAAGSLIAFKGEPYWNSYFAYSLVRQNADGSWTWEVKSNFVARKLKSDIGGRLEQWLGNGVEFVENARRAPPAPDQAETQQTSSRQGKRSDRRRKRA